MGRIMSPCKACIERKLGCHGSCESYFSWRKTIHEQNRYTRNMAMDTYNRAPYSRRNIIENSDSKMKKIYGGYKT